MIENEQCDIKIKEILNKYKLSRPLPAEEQKYIFANLGKNYKKVLKKTGKYSLITALGSTLYFLYKKLGITSLIGKSIITIITATSITSGSYLVNKLFIQSNEDINRTYRIYDSSKNDKHNKTAETVSNKIDSNHQQSQVKNTISVKGVSKQKAIENRETYDYVIGMVPFDRILVYKDESKELEDQILKGLIKAKGKSYITRITDPSKKVRYKIVGSVKRILDNAYLANSQSKSLSFSIIDTKTSNIIFIENVNFMKAESHEISNKCKLIIKRILTNMPNEKDSKLVDNNQPTKKTK